MYGFLCINCQECATVLSTRMHITVAIVSVRLQVMGSFDMLPLDVILPPFLCCSGTDYR
jgi:hypothetical protein